VVFLELTGVDHLLRVVLALVGLELFRGVARVIGGPAILESVVFGGCAQ